MLVFTNSRNGVHAMAAHLHQALAGTRWPVHLHFGALPAVQRERVEEQTRSDRGALFHAGSMRRLMSGGDGTAYLGEVAKGSHSLARIKATGPALPMSRSIGWALARLNGYDPLGGN